MADNHDNEISIIGLKAQNDHTKSDWEHNGIRPLLCEI